MELLLSRGLVPPQGPNLLVSKESIDTYAVPQYSGACFAFRFNVNFLVVVKKTIFI